MRHGTHNLLGAEKNSGTLFINYNTLIDLVLRHCHNSLALVGALVILMCICNSSLLLQTYAKPMRPDRRFLSNF
ncbi:hypothetical protein ACHAWO_007348 [Cyclotella atomus]|uniref:Uncharacterized protein n=1 Tax=Cyclotella atomus TaxID=382360 RepID=A0ABD3P8R4_9STRA